jgi:hypothetical protein
MVNPAHAAEYEDTTKLTLGPEDILIIRSEQMPNETLQELANKLRDKNPAWLGLLLNLRPDESLEKIPAPMAQALYARLHQAFGPRVDRGGFWVTNVKRGELVDRLRAARRENIFGSRAGDLIYFLFELFGVPEQEPAPIAQEAPATTEGGAP